MLSLVTSLYDLGRREDNPRRQSIDFYLEQARPVLELPYHLSIFCDPEVAPRISAIRGDRPGQVISSAFEHTHYYKLLPEVREQRQARPLATSNPNKDTPLYYVFQQSKIWHLKLAAEASSLGDTVAWIDIGIAKAVPMEHVVARLEAVQWLDGVGVCGTHPMQASLNLVDYLQIRHRVCAGFIAGPGNQVLKFCESFLLFSELLLDDGIAAHDETILENVLIGTTLPQWTAHTRERVATARAGWRARVREVPSHVGIFADPALGDTYATMFPDSHPRAYDRVAEAARVPNPIWSTTTEILKIRPLLGLVMIVRNEAHGIKETLDSVLPYVDCATILDTGSTDGTPDIIRRMFADREFLGWVALGEFHDFSQARNKALELHGTRTIYTLTMDADDILEHGDELRRFLTAELDRPYPGPGENPETCYNINLYRHGNLSHFHYSHLSYYLPLVQQAIARHRYTGRVHESLPAARANIPAPVRLTRNAKETSAAASQQRWRRDLEWLEADIQDDPGNARATFYLARTLDQLSGCASSEGEASALLVRAMATYEQRARMGGWHEEVYESLFAKAGLMRKNGLMRKDRYHQAHIIHAYLRAFEADPARAEPLYEIAAIYYDLYRRLLTPPTAVVDADRKFTFYHQMVYTFARRAFELAQTVPQRSLWIDQEVYDWKAADLCATAAFYVGDKELGRRASAIAAKARPGNQRLVANHLSYTRRAKELFGAEITKLDVETLPGWSAFNPSIMAWPNGGGFSCVVRSSNYKIVDGKYLTPDDNVIYTRNYMVEIDGPSKAILRQSEILHVHPMPPRSDFPCHGFEDLRLFSSDGQLYATATVCDFAQGDRRGMREIVLLSISPFPHTVTRAVVLNGPWDDQHQKNWMPFQGGTPWGGYHPILYALNEANPVLTVCTHTGVVSSIGNPPRPAMWEAGGVRGGSQLVQLDRYQGIGTSFLGVVHEVVLANGKRHYLHRFVLVGPTGRLLSSSEPFYFTKIGIEFCAGLAIRGDEVVASFGVDDSTAHLATMPLARVLAALTASSGLTE